MTHFRLKPQEVTKKSWPNKCYFLPEFHGFLYRILQHSVSYCVQEQIETAARIINCLRKEHLARGVAVREAIQSETQLIRKTQTDQDSKLKHLEIQKQNTREKAENIGKPLKFW